MDAIEIGDFLRERTTGVLGLGKDDEGYAIPLSFVYRDEGPSLYFRLGYGPDSQKRAFVDAADTVSFVVYDETGGGWKSVVARGELEELSTSTADSSVVQAVRGLDIPYFRVFDRETGDVEFSIVRLHVTGIDGLVAGEP